jgi:hypothetical protein
MELNNIIYLSIVGAIAIGLFFVLPKSEPVIPKHTQEKPNIPLNVESVKVSDTWISMLSDICQFKYIFPITIFITLLFIGYLNQDIIRTEMTDLIDDVKLAAIPPIPNYAFDAFFYCKGLRPPTPFPPSFFSGGYTDASRRLANVILNSTANPPDESFFYCLFFPFSIFSLLFYLFSRFKFFCFLYFQPFFCKFNLNSLIYVVLLAFFFFVLLLFTFLYR